MQREARQLSDRERTVLLLAADGLTDKEIARHLQLSQRTIGTYWERMREKLGRYSRTQLVARFVRAGAEMDESANYRSLFAAWEEGVWIISPEGETLYANHCIAELFNLTSEQFEAVNARQLLETATSTSLNEIVNSVEKDKSKIEFRIQKDEKTGVWIAMQASAVTNGKPATSAIILRLTDVTIQKRVKHTLDSCESSLTFLSDHSSDLIARFDSGLECISVNPSFAAHFGGKAQVVGKTVHELPEVFNPNTKWIRCLKAALETGEPQGFQCAMPGIDCELQTYVLPIPSEEEKPTAIMSITKLVAVTAALSR